MTGADQTIYATMARLRLRRGLHSRPKSSGNQIFGYGLQRLLAFGHAPLIRFESRVSLHRVAPASGPHCPETHAKHDSGGRVGEYCGGRRQRAR